eukprot:TRINITY_DN36638_c0_g1_i1.p1 TRINITY_DN36638_c0_g1~~TRINITY_DN36638_c0_g1_i1.p1  ORF type:complete len:534 (-),score=107.33 TRINITY_DN36638_c0_g1_i1:68-1669(-)
MPVTVERKVAAGRQRCLTAQKEPKAGGKCVVYWMSRDQRAADNWALLRAFEIGKEHNVAVLVVFNLVPKFLEATERMFGFMLKGLEETEAELRSKNIPFHLLMGNPVDTIPKFISKVNAVAVVCDMSPLRVPMAWCKDVAKKLAGVPMIQVDAHNVVPVWVASDKQEVGARTIRKKIQNNLPEYLTDFPALKKQESTLVKKAGGMPTAVNWTAANKSLKIDRSVKEVTWIQPGASAASKALARFCKESVLAGYLHRNDPLSCKQSGLSPWTHFGQLAPQRAALAVKAAGKGKAAAASKEFLEEAVVRRELSDNFCFYNPKYDRIEGAAGWAQASLKKHSKDKREYLYGEAQLDKAQTHDPLWNAAQNELRGAGKMHGFMRMYWAKKILEWTKSPEEALRIGIKLNDKYSLDGRDPNGYTGVAWSVMGIHDMGWTERKVFGKIRYMNYNGCKTKFKVVRYEERWKEPRDADPNSLGSEDTPGAHSRVVRTNRGAQTAEGGNPKKRKADSAPEASSMKKQKTMKTMKVKAMKATK